MKIYKALPLLLIACCPQFAGATLIDSFFPIDHSLDRILVGNAETGSSYVESFAGYGIGGERDLEFYLQDPSGGAFNRAIARYERVPGDSFEAFRFGVLGPGAVQGASRFEVSLQYDGIGDEEGNEGLGRRLTSNGSGERLLSGTEGGFRVWYWEREGTSFGSKVILRQDGQIIAESFSEIGAGNSSLIAAYYPFEPEELAVADSITLTLYGNAIGNQQPTIFLSHIDTILPEPGTYAIFGGGLAYLAWRRKKGMRKVN